MVTERERLLNMLKENKISKDEYQLLVAAVDKKSSRTNFIVSLLANPFQKIAGFYALIAGLIVIFSMSYLGVIAKVYFPGMFGPLNASIVKSLTIQPNFLLLCYQNLVSWIILTIMFITAAKIFKQRKIRLVDFFGMVALSRFPSLILTGLLSIIRTVNPSFMEVDFTKEHFFRPSLMMSLFSFVVIFCIVWQIIIYFSALKESSGLVGKKLWISFIITMILGETIAAPLTMIFF